MRLKRQLALLGVVSILFSCSNNQRSSEATPARFLWAWEREEDLRFIYPTEFGIAFLAQTLVLENDEVIREPRRQPLNVPPGTYLIAVTRIETRKETAKKPTFSVQQLRNSSGYLKKTLELPGVREIQIDFDATVSERSFYESLIRDVQSSIPADFPLGITALASWCIGDGWIRDLPVDDAVPMLFDVGPDEKAVARLLANDGDWPEHKCRGSYGISLDDPPSGRLRSGRRYYYFTSGAWKESDLKRIGRLHEK